MITLITRDRGVSVNILHKKIYCNKVLFPHTQKRRNICNDSHKYCHYHHRRPYPCHDYARTHISNSEYVISYMYIPEAVDDEGKDNDGDGGDHAHVSVYLQSDNRGDDEDEEDDKDDENNHDNDKDDVIIIIKDDDDDDDNTQDDFNAESSDMVMTNMVMKMMKMMIIKMLITRKMMKIIS